MQMETKPNQNINMKRQLLATTLLLSSVGATNALRAEETRPNILFLLADDLGYNELGCYGSDVIETPIMDQLAAEGMRFTDFHAGNAVSSASRAVIMTGMHSGVNTIRGNQGHNLPNGNTRVPLKKEDITIAEMLRDGGYQTAFIGKWHVEDPCDLSTWAFSRGFDYAVQEQWGDRNCAGAYTLDMEYVNGLQDSIFYDNKKWDCKDEFRTKIALDYLDTQLNVDQPFFLFMSYRAPHAHEWYINNKELYADRGWPENERMHAAKVTLLDREIGKLIAKLDDMALMDNTLVIITSDNGPHNEGHDYEFNDANGDLRGFKRDMYEGGHRVPCIAYWRGKVVSGVVSDFMCGGQDFMATMADAAGVKCPKQSTGLSLIPVITGEKEPKRDKLYWEIYDSGLSRQAVRMGEWKAVRHGMDQPIRLYNLNDDLGESLDLAAERPDIVKRIEPLFESMRSEDPLFPRHNSPGQKRLIETKVRQQNLFNEGWKFDLSDNPKYREVEFDDSAWRELTLPHDWSVELDYNPNAASGGNNGYFDEGIGWYRKSFTVSKEQLDKKLVVQFDGVFMNSEVWINGVFLGRRPFGYATFQYDMTPYINGEEGAENVISVRVDNSLPQGSRWYNGSGIYRNVHLIETNFVHFNNYDGVYITTPTAEKQRAVVNVDYKVFSAYVTAEELSEARKKKYFKESKPYNFVVRSIIYDHRGIEVSRTAENMIINSLDRDVAYSQQVVVDNPMLWSAENPNIYYMRSELVLENKVLDDKITPFGIRKLEYNKDRGMLINDEQVKLNGVCLHHDAASLGAAVPDEVWHYRLSKLKSMGCNAIRTSHNPFSPEFYHMCDTMGFYVMDECFDEWRDGWPFNYTENAQGKAQNSYHLYFDQWAETDLEDMIRRDRNHPSVVMYGIGNEVPFFKDPKAAETTRKLVEICHREDPTRPVSLGNNASEHTMLNGVDDQMDIMGYNYIMRQQPDSLYGPMRREFPDKLFLGSETDRNIKYFLAYRDNDYVIGQFIWTGIDYLGETRQAPQRGWQSSLLDVTLNPRHEGLLFECCWSKEPKVKLAVANMDQDADKYIYMHGVMHTPVLNKNPQLNYIRSWNWEKGDSLSVNIYSNCEQVELKVNGRRIARKDNDMMSYTTTFELPYSAGQIEAIGYNGGKMVSSDVIKSASAATKISAKAVNSTIAADGRSVAIIEVQIVDQAGNPQLIARNNVAVEVEGAAKFIGMDTGNLFYDGNFKTPNRAATNGRVLVYLQSTGEKGKATVKLTSEGLTPTEVVIDAE